MLPPRSLFIATCLLWSSLVHDARAQTTTPLPELFADAARQHLRDPAWSAPFGEHVRPGRVLRWIEGLHVQLRAFDRFAEDRAALGFTYDFAKSLNVAKDADGTSFDFVANGNVAFDRDTNPDDHAWTAFRVRWFGTRALDSAKDARGAVEENLVAPSADELAALDPDRYVALSNEIAHGASTRAIRDDPDFRALSQRYVESLDRTLPAELVWNVDMHLGFESTQDWSSRQTVFGGTVSGRLTSWNPDSSLSRWNLFDAPAAAVRWLAGRDERFRLTGGYPTLAIGLDVVDASQDDTRNALTDDDSYFRARFEAGVRSPVFDLDDERLFLSARWRFHQEVDPVAAVKRAGTDDSSHLAIALDLPKGWELTYTTGRLPLDAQDDSTVALGFNVQF